MNKIPTYKAEQFEQYAANHLDAEASMLGLGVGQWPISMVIEGIGNVISNGRPFRLWDVNSKAAKYLQEGGKLFVTIWND